MSTYTIVKSYKVYQGANVSPEPIREFEGVQQRHWLQEHGYRYDEAEQIMKRLDRAGSVRLQDA